MSIGYAASSVERPGQWSLTRLQDTYLYPLRETKFEGVKAKIPYKFRDFLVGEYGGKALSNTEYN